MSFTRRREKPRQKDQGDAKTKVLFSEART